MSHEAYYRSNLSDYNKTIAEALKKWRVTSGLTLDSASELLTMPTATYSTYEGGKVSIPAGFLIHWCETTGSIPLDLYYSTPTGVRVMETRLENEELYMGLSKPDRELLYSIAKLLSLKN